MPKYIITGKAEQDLAEIVHYIANDQPKRAFQWLDNILEVFDRIAAHPEIGRSRLDLIDLDVKFWPFGNYFIIYRKKKVVEILHVVSSYRDIPTFLHH